MKTTEPNNNNIKNNKMYRLAFLFTVLISLTATASTIKEGDTLNNSLNSELHKLEKTIFVNAEDSASEIIAINDIEVIELEEEVELAFDTCRYLPKNFNALKGKNDLDWNTIELIEIEEDVDLGFDAQKYLPQGFDAHQGEHI